MCGDWRRDHFDGIYHHDPHGRLDRYAARYRCGVGCPHLLLSLPQLLGASAHSVLTRAVKRLSCPGYVGTSLPIRVTQSDSLSCPPLAFMPVLLLFLRQSRWHQPCSCHRARLSRARPTDQAVDMVMKKNTHSTRAGFSVVQLLITVAVIGIVMAMAFVGITKARAHIRRSNSAHQFAMYVERARADAVRRHATTTIQQVNTTTYTVNMDFSGSGTPTWQNFSTENGVTISMPRTVVFDWRGRTPTETNVQFTNELTGSSS